MTEHDALKYEKYTSSVKSEIRELRVILESLEARNKERVWLKRQSDGEIDERRLVAGIAGEKNIYKKRSRQSPDNSLFNQPLPKRMHFLFDLSMSMSRFAGDGRLQRSLEAATMIMEAVKGFEHKFSLAISGHSGDTDSLPLVEFEDGGLETAVERLKVLRKMYAHTEVCDSGDSSIRARRKAAQDITKKEVDDYFVFLIRTQT